LLVKSNECIFGDTSEVQSSDDGSYDVSGEMWSTIQQRITDLLDEGKFLNGPLDPAVGLEHVSVLIY
jgi:hypothetical protein